MFLSEAVDDTVEAILYNNTERQSSPKVVLAFHFIKNIVRLKIKAANYLTGSVIDVDRRTLPQMNA
ncbi:hypothetical protein [Mucilaginibacter psychrotolerans]|uniref:Uncharacterized protein n=1 Tax=Mucilaginibacter psychrotolerans TaxID=1524096 RepID=A0A4Y8SGJ3_9SPHI|nr:hypothetical protein [Mucilaginibacter psychrotolerans]TFF37750.1 hypothetical protein E2R66_11320 [Mucilaginibacter psychrotolerans]